MTVDSDRSRTAPDGGGSTLLPPRSYGFAALTACAVLVALLATGSTARLVLPIAVLVTSLTVAHGRATARRLEGAEETIARMRATEVAKRSMLSSFSHGVRTPLTAVMGYTQLLRRRADVMTPEMHAVALERLAGSAKRVNRLMANLTDIDMLASGGLKPRLQQADLRALVDDVLTATDLGCRVLHVDVEQVSVLLDPSMIERAIDGLLSNVARFTPEQATVFVGARSTPDGLLIRVDDDGPGVAHERREEIFHREDFSGSDTDLSLIRLFVEAHGGRAWVDEAPGGGASFRLLLPAAVAPEGTREPERVVG